MKQKKLLNKSNRKTTTTMMREEWKIIYYVCATSMCLMAKERWQNDENVLKRNEYGTFSSCQRDEE
jgi:hypothetical protein